MHQIIYFASFLMLAGCARVPCQVKLNCQDEGQVVQASDGIECHIYPSRCHLKNANCDRDNVYFQTYQPINIDDCRMLCTKLKCPDRTAEFCAKSGKSEKKTFKNQCEMRREMCTKSTYWEKLHLGKCG